MPVQGVGRTWENFLKEAIQAPEVFLGLQFYHP